MAEQASHLHLVPPPPERPAPQRQALGAILLGMRAVSPARLLDAVAIAREGGLPLAEVLAARGWVGEAALLAAQAQCRGLEVVDPVAIGADAGLVAAFGADRCLRELMVPLRRGGAVTVIATARPDRWAGRAALPTGTRVALVLASEDAVRAAIEAVAGNAMAHRAERRVAAAESCRAGLPAGAAPALAAALLAGLAGAMLWPAATFAALFGWALATLVLQAALKAAALVSVLAAPRTAVADVPPAKALPVISVMVPLLDEDDIAPRLVRRLARVDYPRERLDVLLVVEAADTRTRAVLAGHALPPWMRVVVVPDGPLRTKPRALNYALGFCRGSVVGVWDAEDAPARGQLRAVAAQFARSAPEVACLQGILDFYNCRHNWLTRCFAIEYAAWFRVVLPGLARLGLVVPLGGTSVFLRRDALEAVGGWDAHNVTEDADLGLRLARHGLRTELIDSTTEEEPNGRALPWIRQRSRWLKGYAMTWAVHMRDPARLWRELGPWRFAGVQVLFLATLSQFVLAPLLWSLWLLTLGWPHPLAAVLPPAGLHAVLATFAAAELVNLAVCLRGLRGRGHWHLIKWVPTLHLYFPLGAVASYRALWDAVRRPFHWEKTRHGLLDASVHAAPGTGAAPFLLTGPTFPAPAAPPRTRPVLVWSAPRARFLPRPAPARAASAARLAAERPGIEFQTSFECF